MQRALTIAFALAAVVLSVVLVVKSMPARAEPAVTTAGDASPGVGTPADASADAADTANDDAGLLAVPELAPPSLPSLPFDGAPDGGLRLADGTSIAPLGSKAPRQVRFGVVLVTYAGAQGAPAKARTRSEALALAGKLAEDAKADFKGAVQHGDSGSADDAGSVPRGVLEPATEAVLFALGVGATSGVIDTPRGLWIVKRLE